MKNAVLDMTDSWIACKNTNLKTTDSLSAWKNTVLKITDTLRMSGILINCLTENNWLSGGLTSD